MGEYIELINKLRQEAEWEAYLQPHSQYETPKLLSKAADVIEKLSQERKKGKWLEHDTDKTFAKCSECGCYWELAIVKECNMDFCPNCGADMR